MTSSAARAIARVSTYLPLALTVILLIVTTFNSDVLEFVPLELMLAISSLSTLLIAVHIETRLASTKDRFEDLALSVRSLENVQQAYLAALAPPLQTKTLAQAFDAVSGKRTRWGRLRIFAITTQQIVMFFDSHQFSVGRCEVLIYQPPQLESRRGVGAPYVNHAVYPVEKWRSLGREGRIGTLIIRSYDFLPTEYNCIFDDDVLLLGLYESDPSDSTGVKVGSVTMVEGGTPEGQRMIGEYQSRFEKLFELCVTHHGPNP